MILLTGGTGFVGRHITLRFVADRSPVRVLSRRPRTAMLPDAVTWTQGDFGDAASIRLALRDVRTIVHAAAVLPGGSTPDAGLERANAGGTAALATAARESGVRHFVHISSAGVYGDGHTPTPHRESDIPSPETPYERSKLSAERALMSALDGSQVQWTILRPQGLYGPDRPATRQFFQDVAHRRVWLHGPARVVVHPTHINDLVAAVGLVVARDGPPSEVINIAGARSLEFRELIAMVGARMGHVPRQFSAPRIVGQLAAAAAKAWTPTAGHPPVILNRLASAWINRSVSIEKARQFLGFEPAALEWGLDQTAAALLGARAS